MTPKEKIMRDALTYIANGYRIHWNDAQNVLKEVDSLPDQVCGSCKELEERIKNLEGVKKFLKEQLTCSHDRIKELEAKDD